MGSLFRDDVNMLLIELDTIGVLPGCQFPPPQTLGLRFSSPRFLVRIDKVLEFIWKFILLQYFVFW